MKRLAAGVIAVLLPAAAGLVAGVFTGWLAGAIAVLGIFGLFAGLAIGAATVFVDALGREGARAPWPWWGAALGLALGVAALLVFEDAHQRRAFAADLARSRAADSGLPPQEAARAFDEDPDSAIAFLARDADARLDEEALRLTGQGGAGGRFLLRQEGGLRLVAIGPAVHGLPLGVPGGLGTYLVELVVGGLVVRRVLRAGRRRG